MNNLDKLIAQFEKFPGIGARQARRFAFHILTLPQTDADEIAKLITTVHETVIECESCRRFFARSNGNVICNICDDGARDRSKLMVVERDADTLSIERAGAYDGLYFVLGGTVPLLENRETQKLRGSGLKHVVTERIAEGLAEITLAFSVNPDGENTARFVKSILVDVEGMDNVKVSELGRGLSTGSELEYADPDTIKSALDNRH